MEIAGKMARQSAERGFLTRFSRLLILPLLALAACGSPAPTEPAKPTAHPFSAIRKDRAQLEAFMRAFPKGADLHNHLSGAIYAENFIHWAEADGLCINTMHLALAHGPCSGYLVPAAAARTDRPLFDALVAALSMKDFRTDGETGHDHFFATFDKFAPAEAEREGDMLAEALQQAAHDHVIYLELMLSPGMPAARRLGKQVGWDDDLARLRGKLLAAGIDGIVAQARHDMDQRIARAHDLLHCADQTRRQPGCGVTVRFLAQIVRIFPPAEVFAEDLLAFRLVESDARFVGLNIVGPEDDPTSLHDYSLHMRMFGFLHQLDPKVPMSLHAGELVLGHRGGLRRVTPADVRFHVRQAVEVARANRIGHGVDIEHEDNWRQLMAEMAKRHTLVEINLTSNAQILGVTGAAHPFMTYWAAGVPVALSTDDEGVERIDLTHEYVHAEREYALTLPQLVTLSRNSLAYGFIPGANLWADIDRFSPAAPCATNPLGATKPSAACAAFLARSEKARLQWRLEADLARFEATH
jgi:adenosine deaminase